MPVDHERPEHEAHERPEHEAHERPEHERPEHQAPEHETPEHETPEHETPEHETPEHETPDMDAEAGNEEKNDAPDDGGVEDPKVDDADSEHPDEDGTDDIPEVPPDGENVPSVLATYPGALAYNGDDIPTGMPMVKQGGDSGQGIGNDFIRFFGGDMSKRPEEPSRSSGKEEVPAQESTPSGSDESSDAPDAAEMPHESDGPEVTPPAEPEKKQVPDPEKTHPNGRAGEVDHDGSGRGNRTTGGGQSPGGGSGGGSPGGGGSPPGGGGGSTPARPSPGPGAGDPNYPGMGTDIGQMNKAAGVIQAGAQTLTTHMTGTNTTKAWMSAAGQASSAVTTAMNVAGHVTNALPVALDVAEYYKQVGTHGPESAQAASAQRSLAFDTTAALISAKIALSFTGPIGSLAGVGFSFLADEVKTAYENYAKGYEVVGEVMATRSLVDPDVCSVFPTGSSILDQLRVGVVPTGPTIGPARPETTAVPTRPDPGSALVSGTVALTKMAVDSVRETVAQYKAAVEEAVRKVNDPAFYRTDFP